MLEGGVNNKDQVSSQKLFVEFRAGIHNDRGFGNDFRSERGQAA